MTIPESMRFSVFKAPITNTLPLKSVTLQDVYTVIRSAKYSDVTARLRAMETKPERDLCKKYELDYVTFSGTFTKRSDSSLVNHSGYFCVDIDHIGNQIDIDLILNKLLNFYHPALFFKSPSGDGLKLVYKIDIESASHIEYYFAFEDYFKTEHNIDIDIACKDVSRACFLCHDEDCFYSELPETIGIDFINSYKKQAEIVQTEYELGDRLGDLYNQSYGAFQNTVNLLNQAGWKQIDKHKWRRPNKDEGISATLGKVAENIFYPFSSNSQPFEPMKPYTPFQVLALLKYNGDFKEAARSLANEFGTKRQHEIELKEPVISETKALEISELLKRSEIDTSKPIEKPPIILSIREESGTQSVYKRLLTLGNFSCLIGKAKSRKTYLLSLLTAAILNRDCIGKFDSDLPINKRNVLYFDTEQSEYDSYNVIKRIEKLAGGVKMRSFSLREFTPHQRCEIIEYAFQLWGKETGYCVIDGIADLAMAINDEAEATRVVTMLLRLTKQHNCHISTVLHQNKNDNFATGHLGSSVMKKAEILISVTKTTDGSMSSEVSCDLSRGISFESFCIEIDADGLPYVSEPTRKPKRDYSKNFMNPAIAIGMESFSDELKMKVEDEAPF